VITDDGSEALASEEALAYLKHLCTQPAAIESDLALDIVQEIETGEMTYARNNQLYKKMVCHYRDAGVKATTPAQFKALTDAKKKPKEEEPAPAQPQQEQTALDRKKVNGKFHKLGKSLHGDKWDEERALLTKKANPEYKSSKDLSDDQMLDAIETLERLEARRGNGAE